MMFATFEATWNPSQIFILNSCHCGYGALCMLFFSLLFRPLRAYGLMVIIFVIKELVIDMLMEDTNFREQIEDLFWYDGPGSALGFSLYYIYTWQLARKFKNRTTR